MDNRIITAEVPPLRERLRLGYFEVTCTIEQGIKKEAQDGSIYDVCRVRFRKLRRFHKTNKGWMAKLEYTSGYRASKKYWMPDIRLYEILVKTEDPEVARDTAVNQAIIDGFLHKDCYPTSTETF